MLENISEVKQPFVLNLGIDDWESVPSKITEFGYQDKFAIKRPR
jgi:hypothetical protein